MKVNKTSGRHESRGKRKRQELKKILNEKKGNKLVRGNRGKDLCSRKGNKETV